MNQLESIQAPIEKELKEFSQLFNQTFQHDNSLLGMALEYVKRLTGKQMRPMLVMLCAKMWGKVNEEVLHAAVALELLHTASLLHDDVVDESDQRRGEASVNAYTNNKVAVLVGDYMFSKAMEHAALTRSTQFVDIVSQMGSDLVDGELLQLSCTKSDEFTENTYYDIIRKKTASLFCACAQAGVLLAGGSQDDVERMKRFGQLVGICFQLRDDVLDFDSQANTGKPAGNDLKEGKLTLPVIHAINKQDNPLIRDLAIQVRLGKASAERIQSLLDYTFEQDGIAYAEWAIDEFRYMASGLIPNDIDEGIQNAMQQYVDFVAQRKK